MPRSRPTSNPISYHKHAKQYYVTRGGRRIYLGSDKEQALEKYHRLGSQLISTTVVDTRGLVLPWAKLIEMEGDVQRGSFS